MKAAIVVLLSSLLIYRPSGGGFWLQTLFNWMHFPVFGLIALCVFAFTPRDWRASRRYLAALFVTIALGVAVEIAQIPLNRSASIEDVIVDALGATFTLLLLVAANAKVTLKVVTAVAATTLLGVSLVPLVSATQSIIHRNNQFPVIFSGDSGESERSFITGLNIHLLTHWSDADGRLYTKLIFHPNTGWRVDFHDFVPNWTEYSTLVIEFQNEFANDLLLTVRIHDKEHLSGSQPHNDRFNQRITVPTGFTTIEIPLSDVESAPSGRSMNLAKVDGLILFAESDSRVSTLNLFEIRLR